MPQHNIKIHNATRIQHTLTIPQHHSNIYMNTTSQYNAKKSTHNMNSHPYMLMNEIPLCKFEENIIILN